MASRGDGLDATSGLPKSFSAFTSAKAPIPADEIKQLILAALSEDVGPGDVTSLGASLFHRS
jgi:hypothetical protein